MGPGEYLLDKLEAEGLSRDEAWERATGVPPADRTPFAEPTEAPAEIVLGDPKHRRVSNALYKLAADAAKVEADFEYQYGYNADLVRDLAKATAEAGELRRSLNAANLDNAELVDSRAGYALQVNRLNGELSLARRPGRWLKRLALVGWLLALLSGGVLAAEKISGSPIDVLVGRGIVTLRD